MRLRCYPPQLAVGLGVVFLAHPADGLLHAIVEAVRRVRFILDRLVVLQASLLSSAHQGVGVSQPDL